MEIICIKCDSQACVKNGRLHNSQRYKCKNCGYQFTKMTPRGKPKKDKIIALLLYLSGLSMTMTAKIVGVSTQSVMRWIRQWYEDYAKDFIDEQASKNFEEIEIDEMHHFITKKNSLSGYGKLLIIPVELSSGGYVEIVVQKPS